MNGWGSETCIYTITWHRTDIRPIHVHYYTGRPYVTWLALSHFGLWQEMAFCWTDVSLRHYSVMRHYCYYIGSHWWFLAVAGHITPYVMLCIILTGSQHATSHLTVMSTECINVLCYHLHSLCVCMCVCSWHSGCPTSYSRETSTTTHTSRPICCYRLTCLACSCQLSCSQTLRRSSAKPYDWYRPVSMCSAAKAFCRPGLPQWSWRRWWHRRCGRKTRIWSSCHTSLVTWLNDAPTRLATSIACQSRFCHLLTLWCTQLPYGLSVRVPGCQKLQMTA